MIKPLTLLISALALAPSITCAKTHKALTLASTVIAEAQPNIPTRSAKTRQTAAEAFLKTLTEDQRKLAALPLNDGERKKWTNIPTKATDGGIRLGDLSKPQLESACAFLATILSEEGYLKFRNVILADDLLLKNQKQADKRGGFGAANFWVVIFGNPSETEPWAVQIDGHHIAYNLTFVGEKVSLSPSFIGTQPHLFELKDEKITPMEFETKWAYDFMNSLTEEQRTEVVITKKRAKIKAGAGRDGVQPKAQGIACSDLTDEQYKLLLKLVSLWVDDLPETAATARMTELQTQLKKAHFAWNGPFRPGSDASYHLIGPDIIIEYAGQNLGGDPLDHLHSIYRNPKNEYGALWLKPEAE